MNLNDWQILALSALPVSELRVTIPLALSMGMSPLRTYFLAVTGNLIPVLPLLLLLEPASALFRKIPILDKIFEKMLNKTRKKSDRVRKYGYLGLTLFVSIPFPGTGAWTGAILAWLLGLNFLYSTVAICVGVFIAGVIVSAASLGIIHVSMMFGFEVMIFIILALVLLVYLFKRISK